MSLRQRRHAAIAGLLEREPIPSQEALAARLAARGIEATQTTLSRDLRELGVVKGPAGYRLADEPADATPDRLAEVLAGHVLSADVTPPLVVLKTGPGRAQIVAFELDRADLQGVLGTVAGDDTIIIAAANAKAAKTLLTQVRDWAELG
ncbi:MAG: arginine repressor [Phycisphaerales bacterium JB038]